MTRSEDHRIIYLWAKLRSARQIGKALGKSTDQIQTRIGYLREAGKMQSYRNGGFIYPPLMRALRTQ